MNSETSEQNLVAYIAVIVYEITSSSLDHQPLYEESFVLFKASSEEEAQQMALQYAQQEQVTYKNEQQDDITWTVKHVIDVSPLLVQNVNFESGSELYARHFRNYQAYTSFEPLLSGGL